MTLAVGPYVCKICIRWLSVCRSALVILHNFGRGFGDEYVEGLKRKEMQGICATRGGVGEKDREGRENRVDLEEKRVV
jgi:hypothetical protein